MTMCGVGERSVMGNGGGTCADKLIVVVATEARPDRAAQNTRDIIADYADLVLLTSINTLFNLAFEQVLI